MFQRPDENGSGLDAPELVEDTATTLQEGATDAGSTGVEIVEPAIEAPSDAASDVLESADQDRPV